ncbi:hypothetical protein QWC_00155 [Achromobacter marplatensis]|uniref:hypothetical protein n=1 Tax=Achromobacter marplatensis TaxID=470868 RepID=UPI000277E7C8|nr:hypothetical protein [Achromobacter marplatensis]EJO33368.1 hypothetical protein QWC_00155 [Achromobacter marplatensis]
MDIYDDMLAVINLIRYSRSYPDSLSTPVHEHFKEWVKLWRLHLVFRTEKIGMIVNIRSNKRQIQANFERF